MDRLCESNCISAYKSCHIILQAPYGYGKTHGYTRIIRTPPQPLLIGATDTLKTAAQSSSPPMSLSDITLNDLKASLRQQIRYHCRLNHVAAHTAMWTLGMEDFADTGKDWLVEKAQEFLGLDLDQDDLVNQVVAEYDKLDTGDEKATEDEEEDNALDILNHMYLDGAKLMNLVRIRKTMKKKTPSFIMKELDDVLMDEMKISRNLTKWPCESFWTVGEPGNRLQLSPIIRSIAKAISPDCKAPHTSCFVRRDKCEAKGDGECRE